MLTKEEAIEKSYYDPAGFGSLKLTLNDAKKYNPNVTLDDVKKWKEKNILNKQKYRGHNSFIASKPFEEFQIDLMFFSDLKQEINTGLILVDIFSKFCQVIPIKSKQINDVLEGLKKGFEQMRGFPKTVYSDNEPAFTSKEVKKYLDEHNVRQIITLGHAPVAERTIRTIKDMLYKRLEHAKSKKWNEMLYQVLLTYNYRNVNSVTKMTPNDATKSSNEDEVKVNLELRRSQNRKYPDISIGDNVRIFKKKDKLDKQHISNWTDNKYEVEDIIDSFGQKFYKIKGRDKLYMKHEIYLINN